MQPMALHPATPFSELNQKIETAGDLPVADRSVRLHELETPEGRNHMRALFAAEGVRAYGERTGVIDEDAETAIKDVINDLGHLCDALGIDFDHLVERARLSYEEEVTGFDGY